MDTNNIDPSANIDPRVKLGVFNRIGKNVQIKFTDPKSKALVTIGDNNIINDNTRILIGTGNVSIGDWNVFHNDMLLMAGEGLNIGHNCWFGQNTILDGSGKLVIGNGVRVGMYSQLWTHVASGELIEGCLLYGFRETIIEDDAWLVGSCMVSSGIRIGKRSIILSQSNITKDVKPNAVYAGAPAIEKPTINFYKNVTVEQKLEMMKGWVAEFISLNNARYESSVDAEKIQIRSKNGAEGKITLGTTSITDKNETFFNLRTKTFTKKNTQLERDFYKFIYGSKARFIPE